MSIEKHISRIFEEIESSKKSIQQSVALNEDIAFSSPLSKLNVTSKFGPRRGRLHSGVDLAANDEKVKSPANGIVTYTATDEGPCGGTIKIDHPNGYSSGYCHIQRIDVKRGQLVRKGDVIGITGGGVGDPGKGRSDGPHLHFTLKKNGVPIDPMIFLGKEGIISTSNLDIQSSEDDDNFITPDTVIDTSLDNSGEFEFADIKKDVKENIERIKKML
jgi:murein DD-endopeptidase MepM/ murein hydrolase activator NlpD